MIRIDKCVKNPDCIVVTFDGFIGIMSKSDQEYLIGWMKKEKPELMQ